MNVSDRLAEIRQILEYVDQGVMTGYEALTRIALVSFDETEFEGE